MNIKVTSDSTCDLPSELISAHDIGVMPLYIIRDEEALRDGIDVKPEDLYAYTKKTGKLCGTSAVTITDYLGSWKAWLEEYDAIVHVAFSSELSASCNNARLAAMDLPGKVWVVDSLNLSTGFGHLVLDAALMAERGMAPEEIAAETERMVPKMDVSFVLDTLEYMWKGGRCSGVTALGANMLKLKPSLEIRDGKLVVCKKYRGAMEKVYRQYVTERLAGKSVVEDWAFITHSGEVSEETLQELTALVQELAPFKEVFITQAGCTVSSHCGPGTLGVLFLRQPEPAQ